MIQYRKVFSRKNAFTLMELVVVIAVIGLLAAILIPGMQSVRTKALRTESHNNLRQLYNAFTLYANHNQGQLPNSWVAPSEEFRRATTDWRSQLVQGGFVGERTEARSGGQSAYSVFGSPIQRREAAEFTIDRDPPRMATYGMNGELNQVHAAQASNVVTMNRFISPGRTLLLSSGRLESNGWFNVSVQPWIIPSHTDEYIEVLFADGHTATLAVADYPNNSVARTPGSDTWYFWEGLE